MRTEYVHFLFSAREPRLEYAVSEVMPMKYWKAQTVRLDQMEDHLNQLAQGGYEPFGLYPLMAPVGGDEALTTFLVVAKKSLDYIGKEMAQLEAESREQ